MFSGLEMRRSCGGTGSNIVLHCEVLCEREVRKTLSAPFVNPLVQGFMGAL